MDLISEGEQSKRTDHLMLVLTRKVNESLIIGENIVVTVVAVHRDHVRLGVQAPREVPIHRREVYDEIKQAADRETPPKESDPGK